MKNNSQEKQRHHAYLLIIRG
uniref:Uncharacterized protein n=1 Tax=Arundo donax TaxID=35708 RepID=A0A0A9AQQ8_ARUDO